MAYFTYQGVTGLEFANLDVRQSMKIVFVLANSVGCDEMLHIWVKVFRIIPEFSILRMTFYRKSSSKC